MIQIDDRVVDGPPIQSNIRSKDATCLVNSQYTIHNLTPIPDFPCAWRGHIYWPPSFVRSNPATVITCTCLLLVTLKLHAYVRSSPINTFVLSHNLSFSPICLLCKSPQLCPWDALHHNNAHLHASPSQRRGLPCAAHMHPLVGLRPYRWAHCTPNQMQQHFHVISTPWSIPLVRWQHSWWGIIHPIRRTLSCFSRPRPIREEWWVWSIG